MKIILLTRRSVGVAALSWLKAKGYDARVISDDEDVLWLAERLGVDAIAMADVGDGDMLLSVHWHKIIPKEYLQNRIAVNIHPLLSLGDRYKGHNPVGKYIESNETIATIDSHFMTDEVDDGEKIETVGFVTGKVLNYAEFYNIALSKYYYLLEKTFKKLNINP
jgi:methionyl-tRNA formyltransferase